MNQIISPITQTPASTPAVPKVAKAALQLNNQSTFKFIISNKLKLQILELCSRFSNREWSGLLFYQVNGQLSDISNLLVTAEELLLLDIGSSGYTEYDIDEEAGFYMFDNPHLQNYSVGHIHSHHSMAAFFSGTDDEELVDSAIDSNYPLFVSLIVSNSGQYKVALAFKANKNIVSQVTLAYTDLTNEPVTSTETFKQDKLVIIKCMGEIDETSTIDARIKEIEAKKLQRPNNKSSKDYIKTSTLFDEPVSTFGNSNNIPISRPLIGQGTLQGGFNAFTGFSATVPSSPIKQPLPIPTPELAKFTAKCLALSFTYGGSVLQALQSASKAFPLTKYDNTSNPDINDYRLGLESVLPTLVANFIESVDTDFETTAKTIIEYITSLGYNQNSYIIELLECLEILFDEYRID